AGAGSEDVRIAYEQPEVRAVRTCLVDETRVVTVRQLIDGQRLEPRLPAQLLLSEHLGRFEAVADDLFWHHSSPFRTLSPATTRSWKLRNDTSCESVTMPVVVQPASSSACRASAEASLGGRSADACARAPRRASARRPRRGRRTVPSAGRQRFPPTA